MLQPGLVVGGIRIDSLLGRGAMGEVYRGQQLSLKRPVAVKRIAEHLLGDADAIGRFAREAQCVARIQSPYVVAVHDFMRVTDEQGNDHALLVMELVDGGASLRALLADRGQAFDWRTASALVLHAAEGLAAAAEHGVVHRDIKPDNLMVTRKGVAKLADFGLAKSADSSAMTMEGTVMGTPLYLPPEACRGQPVDARGDLYSLGATWFHLLTGRPPFQAASTVALLRAHLDDAPPDVRALAPSVPAAIAALVHRLLAKDPAQRLPSAQALVDELHALAAQGITLPRSVPEVFGVDAATTVTRLAGQAEPLSNSMYVGDRPASATDTLPLSPTAATVLATTMPMTPAPLPAVPATTASVPLASTPTSPTPVPAVARAPTRMKNSPLFLVFTVIVALIVGWVFYGRDGARAGIEQALAANDTGLALQRASTNLAARPNDAEAVALVREVVRADIHALIASQRIEDARKRLLEHRQAFTWLDTGALEAELAIAAAKWLATHHQEKAAVEQFAKLRNAGANPATIDRAMVESLADGDRPAEAIGPAWRMAEASTGPLEPKVLEILTYALTWDGPYGDSIESLRKLLIARHPPIAETVRPWLADEDYEKRYNAYFILRDLGRLDDGEIIRFHVRAAVTLSAVYTAGAESVAWLTAEATKPGWDARVSAAKVPPLTEVPPAFTDKNPLADQTAVVLATLLPLVEERAVAWTADDDDSVRWNALQLLIAGKRVARIDLMAFHARTLATVNALYEFPSFTAALAFFSAKPGTAEAAAAKVALGAGIVHIQAQITDYEKAGGNFMQLRANTCKQRLQQVREVLARF